MSRPGVDLPSAFLVAEIVIVLALSLGRSGVYSIVSLARSLAAGPLSSQQATLNSSQDTNPWFDLLQQLLGIAFTLAPVALVILLLSVSAGSLRAALAGLGLAPARPLGDSVRGVVIAACIGIPGLAVYYAGRAIGATLEVIPAALDAHWWTVPVLILQAAKNAVLEEVIVSGYLVQRLERLGVGTAGILVITAVLRGSYHLYQGIGPGIANLAMGLVFTECFRRTRRVGPLVAAHTLLDVVAFVGYALLKGVLGL
ncbi:CPBP family intramembrane glutamic endopeptidase [Brachybacterium sp. ACRRE]|uniref:CPBP family intramembrane glutamic endopeptidase n=1 Tax=Brachybacterium sp. ACRRE TaxID=2918184 RepID=UPI001EF20D2A|nr:CPBP family intramembrane glutamic endopeptidase [Brachybacterium sp. ACRRE]MCG7310056.1 CPBP family intramembrane metalloprotease [Brachybacterium sp. ACRRE]